MALSFRIPVRFEDVFPHGAFALGVEPVRNYEKAKAGVADAQDRDKDTGERVWAVRVMDPDPTGRAGSAEVKVKVTGETEPQLPPNVGGLPLRPVEFDGVTVTPWVDTSRSMPRVAFSLRAARMRPATSGRPAPTRGAAA